MWSRVVASCREERVGALVHQSWRSRNSESHNSTAPQSMSEHLPEQLRIADSKHPAGKIETSLSGMQCGTEIRPAPNLCMNKKAGSNCREVCKKITAYGTGDGCQRQTAPEPVAASNGETESLKTPQKKTAKSQSRWPQGRTSCHTHNRHTTCQVFLCQILIHMQR